MSYYKLESHDISIKFGRCAQAVNKATLAYKQKGYNSPTTTEYNETINRMSTKQSIE